MKRYGIIDYGHEPVGEDPQGEYLLLEEVAEVLRDGLAIASLMSRPDMRASARVVVKAIAEKAGIDLEPVLGVDLGSEVEG